jgi:hypothetical protein
MTMTSAWVTHRACPLTNFAAANAHARAKREHENQILPVWYYALMRGLGRVLVAMGSGRRQPKRPATVPTPGLAATPPAAAPAAGNVPIPLVKALAAAVANDNPDAARYVHWGATSQDIIDTALVLDLHAGIDLFLADLKRAIAAFAALADRRRRTPTVRWRPHSRSCLAAVAGSRAMSRF